MSRISDYLSKGSPPQTDPVLVDFPIGTPRDWKMWAWLMVAATILYGLLYRGCWLIGGGDDAFYLTVARNILEGHNYSWNGDIVLISPPGWPLLLAAVMKLSPSFAVLALLPPIFMIASAGVWYWVLRRFGSPGRAFAASLFTVFLFQVFRCGMHFYSEAAFCFLLGWATLLAVQITEGREQIWRIALLLIVSAALMFERWTGVMILPMLVFTLVSRRANQMLTLFIALVMAGLVAFEYRIFQRKFVQQDLNLRWWLLRGFIAFAIVVAIPATWFVVSKLRPQMDRRFIAAILTLAVVLGTFQSTRMVLSRLAIDSGSQQSIAADTNRMDKMMGMEGKVGYGERMIKGGLWMGYVLWPAEFLKLGNTSELGFNVLGWCLFGIMGIFLWSAIRQGQWIWLGFAIYLALLVVVWSLPVGRYAVPVIPLFVLALLQGIIKICGERFWAKAIFALLSVSIVGANLAGLGVLVWVVHSPRITHQYNAGQYAALTSYGQYLRSRGVADDQVSINRGVGESRRAWPSPFAIRAFVFLTDRTLEPVPERVCNTAPYWTNAQGVVERSEKLVKWAKDKKVRFYVYRPKAQPAHLWHLTADMLPPMAKKLMNGPTDVPFFELYELKGDRFEKVEIPLFDQAVQRIPGL